MKKSILVLLCIVMVFQFIALPIYASASQVTPYWSNTNEVTISHMYSGGKSIYQVEIVGYLGTTLIDNVDIKLYRIVTDSIMVLDGWKLNLSQTGDEFNYSGSFENVLTGYVYRLKVTADVHRNGTVESIDCYWDVQY